MTETTVRQTTDEEQAGASGAPAEAGTAGRRLRLVNLVLELRAFIALAILIAVFAMLSDTYLTVDNLITMTKHVAINALLAIGLLMVILKGGIDLSVGSIVGLAGVVAGIQLEGIAIGGVVAYPPVWVVIIVTLAVGAGVGAINGTVIAKFNVAPFVATLGMLWMARGAALLISDGKTYPRLGGSPELGNTGFWVLGGQPLLGIPTAIWIMILFALLATLLTRVTPFGRWLYAIGGNEPAAQLSGVPIARVKVTVYMISGVCAAMAGLIIASELTSAAPQTGEMFELRAIAAVVIGGASLMGGRGTVRGALLGAFVIGFLADGLVMVGVSTFWQVFIMGAVIVLAVIIDQAQQRIQVKEGATAAADAARTEPAKA